MQELQEALHVPLRVCDTEKFSPYIQSGNGVVHFCLSQQILGVGHFHKRRQTRLIARFRLRFRLPRRRQFRGCFLGNQFRALQLVARGSNLAGQVLNRLVIVCLLRAFVGLRDLFLGARALKRKNIGEENRYPGYPISPSRRRSIPIADNRPIVREFHCREQTLRLARTGEDNHCAAETFLRLESVALKPSDRAPKDDLIAGKSGREAFSGKISSGPRSNWISVPAAPIRDARVSRATRSACWA